MVFYSRMTPALSQVSMVSRSQMPAWTSPMWARPRRYRTGRRPAERRPILLAEFLTEDMTFLKARSNTRPAVRELYDFFSRRGET